ncbi:uncharacterized protein [Dermacentor albipictus]|uniref:uncharacterized protein n=1 Tax=Dermacentor albipictus TaxID=60249 RepID=UPI0038FC7518
MLLWRCSAFLQGQSVNTSMKIWLYDRSYIDFTGKYSHECLYHQKIYLSEEYYVFLEGYGEEVSESVLYATLCQNRTSKKGVMKVGKSFGHVDTTYTLEYWDEKNLCSVFTFKEHDMSLLVSPRAV